MRCIDYFDEVDRFYAWSMANSPSSAAFAVWHALMHTWCSIGRPETFTIAVKALSVKTGLEKAAIMRARNSLKQLGRIDWHERRGGLSAKYRIITFGEAAGAPLGESIGESMGESMGVPPCVTVGGSIIDNSVLDYLDNVNDVVVNNSGCNSVSEVASYLKRQVGIGLSVRAERNVMAFLGQGAHVGLILRAIDASVDAGANNWVYAEKTIANCIKKGIFTLADYERAEELREAKKASSACCADSPKNKNKFRNFKERTSGFGVDFEELARLERERIDNETGDEL